MAPVKVCPANKCIFFTPTGSDSYNACPTTYQKWKKRTMFPFRKGKQINFYEALVWLTVQHQLCSGTSVMYRRKGRAHSDELKCTMFQITELHWRPNYIYLSYTYLDMHVQDINIAKWNNIELTQLGLLSPLAKSPSRGLIWLNRGWIKKWKLYSSANHKCLFLFLACPGQPTTNLISCLPWIDSRYQPIMSIPLSRGDMLLVN